MSTSNKPTLPPAFKTFTGLAVEQQQAVNGYIHRTYAFGNVAIFLMRGEAEAKATFEEELNKSVASGDWSYFGTAAKGQAAAVPVKVQEEEEEVVEEVAPVPEPVAPEKPKEIPSPTPKAAEPKPKSKPAPEPAAPAEPKASPELTSAMSPIETAIREIVADEMRKRFHVMLGLALRNGAGEMVRNIVQEEIKATPPPAPANGSDDFVDLLIARLKGGSTK